MGGCVAKVDLRGRAFFCRDTRSILVPLAIKRIVPAESRTGTGNMVMGTNRLINQGRCRNYVGYSLVDEVVVFEAIRSACQGYFEKRMLAINRKLS